MLVDRSMFAKKQIALAKTDIRTLHAAYNRQLRINFIRIRVPCQIKLDRQLLTVVFKIKTLFLKKITHKKNIFLRIFL